MDGSLVSLPPLSPIVSRSSPPRCADIDVCITSATNDAFTLQLPTTTTIGTLRSLINLRTNIPQETISIWHGKQETKVTLLTKTLEDFTQDDTPLAFSIRVEAVRTKAKRPRCSMAGCNERPSAIAGVCSYCPGVHCSKHRTLQMHRCSGQDKCKEIAWQRNADELASNRTVATKGLFP